jgi:hypothetical protein
MGVGGASGAGGSLGTGGAAGAAGAGGATSSGGASGSGGSLTGGTSGNGGSSGAGGSATGGSGNPTCQSGETAFGGHCYFFNTSARSNTSATSLCAGRGAGYHLITVESSTENQFLSGLVGGSETWLGAGDAAAEGTFLWVNGQTFWTGGASGTPIAGAYTNFGSGEPNNAGGGASSSNADCLRMVSGGSWRDSACGDGFRTVCEK